MGENNDRGKEKEGCGNDKNFNMVSRLFSRDTGSLTNVGISIWDK
jgi:hypothetical protein